MSPRFSSQHGEDLLLSLFFRGVPEGVCVEVGAHDGVQFSNTLHFEQIGWTCILVEPNPALCELIRKQRRGLLFECAASNEEGSITLHVAEGVDLLSTLEENEIHFERIRREGGHVSDRIVAKRPLDRILEQAGVSHVDFISIDVEGHELQVLQGLSLRRWRPRIALIEDNSNLTDHRVDEYMNSQGYVRFYRTACNDWYAARSDRELGGLCRLLRSDIFVNRKTVIRLRIPNHLRGTATKAWRFVRYAAC